MQFHCGKERQGVGLEGNEKTDEPGLFIIGLSGIRDSTFSETL